MNPKKTSNLQKTEGGSLMYIIRLRPFLVWIGIALALGLVSGGIALGGLDFYTSLHLPAGSPPAALFPRRVGRLSPAAWSFGLFPVGGGSAAQETQPVPDSRPVCRPVFGAGFLFPVRVDLPFPFVAGAGLDRHRRPDFFRTAYQPDRRVSANPLPALDHLFGLCELLYFPWQLTVTGVRRFPPLFYRWNFPG